MKSITESSSGYDNLECKSVRELLEGIHNEDKKILPAIEKVIPQIEKLITRIENSGFSVFVLISKVKKNNIFALNKVNFEKLDQNKTRCNKDI